jgi:hypothetical protein
VVGRTGEVGGGRGGGRTLGQRRGEKKKTHQVKKKKTHRAGRMFIRKTG